MVQNTCDESPPSCPDDKRDEALKKCGDMRVIRASVPTGPLFSSESPAAKRAAENLLAPWGRELFFLPGMLAAAMAGTLLAGPDRVWQASGAVSPWLLAPFALAVALALPAAVIKRLRRKS